MIVAPFPDDEGSRIALLEAHGLLEATPDAFLDTAVTVVAAAFRVPMCVVSFVDRSRQFFKARAGVALTETPRDCSFCAHVLWDTGALVVPDARSDSRFHDNPLVIGPPFVRFYAGVPLRLRGICLGTLCILDHRPRPRFGATEVDALEGAAFAIEERLIAIAEFA